MAKRKAPSPKNEDLNDAERRKWEDPTEWDDDCIEYVLSEPEGARLVELSDAALKFVVWARERQFVGDARLLFEAQWKQLLSGFCELYHFIGDSLKDSDILAGRPKAAVEQMKIAFDAWSEAGDLSPLPTRQADAIEWAARDIRRFLKLDAKPTETPRGCAVAPLTDKDERNKWIYAECCRMVPYDDISRKLKAKKNGWPLISSKQGILSAAKTYAAKFKKDPPPARQGK